MNDLERGEHDAWLSMLEMRFHQIINEVNLGR